MYHTMFTHSNQKTGENRSTPLDVRAELFDFILNILTYFTFFLEISF